MILINVLVILGIIAAVVIAFVEDTIEVDHETKVMEKMNW